jgi:DNA replication and repair protein RecF
MVAVCGDHVVIIPHGGHGAGGYGFLSYIQVAEAAYFLHAIQLTGFFFKFAKKKHDLIPIQICFFAKRSLHYYVNLCEFIKTFVYIAALIRINKISLLQYRNYTSSVFALGAPVTCITGPNGSGKTNLLDAVYYLCYTKSYFSAYQQHSAQGGTDGFRITGQFLRQGREEAISAKWKAGKKEIFKNEVEYDKITDHIGIYSAVMIAPDDTELINGGSELRRKWVDSILGQVDKVYLEQLIRYQRVLLQRNAWLKIQGYKPAANNTELEYYDAQLAADGTYIYEQRTRFITDLLPLLNDFYHRLSGGHEPVQVTYTSDLAQKPLADWLAQNLQHDLRYQRTLRGIHKDDWDFRLNDMGLKQFGSQGQKKSFLFALKLAQYAYLSKVLGHLPILLLDDIFEKLDQNRMEALLRIIQGPDFGQVILTDTHPERIAQAFGAGAEVGFIHLGT